MSQSQQSPELEISEDYWVELEVPYNLIEQDWNSEYRDKLNRHVEKYRINKHLLKIYWKFLENDDLEEMPHQLKDIVSDIEEHGKEWLINILCVFDFSRGKNSSFVDSIFKDIESEAEKLGYEDIYDSLDESGTKNAKVGLIQVVQSDRLKDILGLQQCYRPKPQLVTESEHGLGDIDDLDMDEVINVLERITGDQYENWHSFGNKGKLYFLIKRDLTDDVERQVGGNIEEEPAEFLVLVFNRNELHIYSEQSAPANAALNGVNKAIEHQYQEEIENGDNNEVDEDELKNRQFESPDVGVDYDQFESAIENTTDVSENTNLVLKSLSVTGIDLPHDPDIELETERGLEETLDWFEDRDISLLDQPDDVNRITFKYNDRDWTLIPKETESNWVFQYEAKVPDEDDQMEFEGKIKQYMGVDIIFQKT